MFALHALVDVWQAVSSSKADGLVSLELAAYTPGRKCNIDSNLRLRRLRVTEHNILVVCKYYSRIRLARLAQLLDLPVAEAERHLSDMVVSGALSAKIDRPAGAPRMTAHLDALSKRRRDWPEVQPVRLAATCAWLVHMQWLACHGVCWRVDHVCVLCFLAASRSTASAGLAAVHAPAN